MKSILSAVLFLTFAASAQAETVWMNALGCKSKDTAIQAFKLLSDGDQAGHDRMAKEKAASGECTALKKETTVTMEDIALEDGIACVKPSGASACLWMPLGQLN